MKPEQQRIAIAEVCGWKLNSDDPSPSWSKTWINPFTKKIGYEVKDMPDYLNDLNAMHKAETLLRENQFHFVDYYGNLFRVVSGSKHYDGNIGYFGFELITATASQRAEAFLRTIGKWID